MINCEDNKCLFGLKNIFGSLIIATIKIFINTPSEVPRIKSFMNSRYKNTIPDSVECKSDKAQRLASRMELFSTQHS